MVSGRVENTGTAPNNVRGHPTLKKILKRMRLHGINLDYLTRIPESKTGLIVYENTLEGITFKIPTDIKIDDLGPFESFPLTKGQLTRKLKDASHTFGKSFKSGPDPAHSHWAFDLSMAATQGEGFREIGYFGLHFPKSHMPGRTIELDGQGPTATLHMVAHFDGYKARLILKSLHCAIFNENCSIHIDEVGFVINAHSAQGARDVALTPDLFHHLVIELGVKTLLGLGHSFNAVLPNASNDYDLVHIGYLKSLSKSVQFSLGASLPFRKNISIMKNKAWKAPVELKGTRHDIIPGSLSNIYQDAKNLKSLDVTFSIGIGGTF